MQTRLDRQNREIRMVSASTVGGTYRLLAVVGMHRSRSCLHTVHEHRARVHFAAAQHEEPIIDDGIDIREFWAGPHEPQSLLR